MGLRQHPLIGAGGEPCFDQPGRLGAPGGQGAAILTRVTIGPPLMAAAPRAFSFMPLNGAVKVGTFSPSLGQR
jgi:hypothetical protein